MPKQATTDGFEDGVNGAGNKWKKRVDQAADEGRYGTGDNGRENYSDNAGTGDADEKYRRNVAASFGLSEDNIRAAPSDGIDDDAADRWASGVSGASDRWADGVKDVSSSEWEEKTAGASSEWLQNTKEGLAPDE